MRELVRQYLATTGKTRFVMRSFRGLGWQKGKPVAGTRKFNWKNTDTGETRQQISEPGSRGKGKKATGKAGSGKKRTAPVAASFEDLAKESRDSYAAGDAGKGWRLRQKSLDARGQEWRAGLKGDEAALLEKGFQLYAPLVRTRHTPESRAKLFSYVLDPASAGDAIFPVGAYEAAYEEIKEKFGGGQSRDIKIPFDEWPTGLREEYFKVSALVPYYKPEDFFLDRLVDSAARNPKIRRSMRERTEFFTGHIASQIGWGIPGLKIPRLVAAMSPGGSGSVNQRILRTASVLKDTVPTSELREFDYSKALLWAARDYIAEHRKKRPIGRQNHAFSGALGLLGGISSVGVLAGAAALFAGFPLVGAASLVGSLFGLAASCILDAKLQRGPEEAWQQKNRQYSRVVEKLEKRYKRREANQNRLEKLRRYTAS